MSRRHWLLIIASGIGLINYLLWPQPLLFLQVLDQHFLSAVSAVLILCVCGLIWARFYKLLYHHQLSEGPFLWNLGWCVSAILVSACILVFSSALSPDMKAFLQEALAVSWWSTLLFTTVISGFVYLLDMLFLPPKQPTLG